MVTRLLDANLPIVLFDADRVHHPIGREWFIALDRAHRGSHRHGVGPS